MRRAKSMYVYDVKTQKLHVRGTPCTCCSRSQQRSSPGLQLRLTPLLVLIEREWWVSHSLITSVLLIYMTKHISLTCGRRSCRLPQFVKQHSQPYFQALSCNSSSSVFLNHDRTIHTNQRCGSKASWFRKHCHEGSTTGSHVVTPLVYGCCSTCSRKLYLHFSWNAYILRLSESRPIPWFLTKEVEVLVDLSTWTNLKNVEPGTNDRDLFVKFIRAAKLRTVLAFCTAPSL